MDKQNVENLNNTKTHITEKGSKVTVTNIYKNDDVVERTKQFYIDTPIFKDTKNKG